MSNSSLAKYTKLSPNNSGKRTHSIDRITPHCVVGQLSVETLGNLFAKSSYKASCNYAIGADGRVALIVDEGERSWCSSSNANDQRAVTIECASDKTAPYAFSNTVYNKLILLCVDICRRNGKTKLLWISDKTRALSYVPKSDEMLLTVHRWFANKSCPGDWLMQRMGELAAKVTAELGKNETAVKSETKDLTPQYYRVRKSWADIDSQVGAYLVLDNAKAEADKRGSAYAVYDSDGKEIYRTDKVKEKEITFFYPGYLRKSSPDDRQGAGCVWHDQNGNCIVIDAYTKNSDAGKGIINHLVASGIREYDAVGTHAHYDHISNFFVMLDDDRLRMKNLYVYDPATLKLAGTGSANARSAKEDKEYLQKLIDKAEAAGVKVHYVKTGDVITCGEIRFEAFRSQPTAFGQYDTGEAWGYLNDGSINLYERDARVLLTGDGGSLKASQHFKSPLNIVEVEHHGNGGGKSTAADFKGHGCQLAIECNNEKNGPGSCEFTRYGSGRTKEAGIEVWMLDQDIIGTIRAGEMTVKQGGKTRTFAVPFGQVFYRVRKSWEDAASQIGAYTQIEKAKECVDQHPGYAAYDESGTKIYPAAEQPAVVSDEELFIGKIEALACADMAKSGVLASVTIAQAILESGWGKSELAVNAKNIFGMKKSLSGNTWPGSTWDGKSSYSKLTKEVYASGPATVQADFRAYPTWEASVGDHSAYLTGAKNGSKLRYAGLAGCTDYKKAAEIIKAGGYATATDYVSKICRIIEQYNLTVWDQVSAEPAKETALDDLHTVKWSGKTKVACKGYLYPDTTSKVTLEAAQGTQVGVCKGQGKFYMCKVGETYGYIHRSHITK